MVGQVRDSNTTTYLVGATVTLDELGRQTTTGSDGSYRFSNLPAGNYTVSVSSLGYGAAHQSFQIEETGTAQLDVDLVSEILVLDDFVVEGTREGQARALQQKLTADSVMEVVSADAVGKFPDGNAAEALRRVPGISLEIDQDEGRFVVLRGIDSALNTVTLNNQLIGTPAEGANRGIAMDSVPADLIARLEVVKAVTPDMDANAIGGSINIVTQSAFDRAEPFLFGSLGSFVDHFSGDLTPDGSVTAGTVFGPDHKWGIVVGGSYSLKKFESQTVNTRSWAQTNGYWVPLTEQAYAYEVERERLGANLALQFRPSTGHEFALRLNHNEFTDEEGRQSVYYEYVSGTLTDQTETSGTDSKGRASRQYRDYKQTGTIDAASLEGKHTLGDLLLEWQLGASRGERETPRRVDWEYRSSSSAFPNSYDLSGDVAVVTPASDAYYDASKYPFRRVRFRTGDEIEDVYSGQADLSRDITIADHHATWKIGAKVVSREKKDDRENANYTATGGDYAFTLGDGDLAGDEIDDYFRGLFRYGPTLNLKANQAYFAAHPEAFTYDELGSLSDSLASDYDASEDVLAGYAQMKVALTGTLETLFGVRVENTDTTYGANELETTDGTFNGSYHRVTGGRNYTNVLPGVHFTWRPQDRLALRAAWTNTIGRPNYADLAPCSTLDSSETDTDSGIYTGTLETGNPDLKAYESTNLDVSAEYYLGDGGILSLGVFHKEIENPVFTRTVIETGVTYDDLYFETLTRTSPENARSGRISGLEINYQQFFKFLPAPLDGLGVNCNATFTDSSVGLFDRSDRVPFFKQADRVANVALIYEKGRLALRVAWSYSGDYLSEVGADTDTDIYVRGRAVVDAKISCRITRNLTLFVEGLNLTNEPLREYTGIRKRENDYEIYDWKARFGVNFNL